MNEDVIPRLVFGWTGSSDPIVPLVRPLKGFVHSDDDPSVVKLPMMDRLPDGEGAHLRLTSPSGERSAALLEILAGRKEFRIGFPPHVQQQIVIPDGVVEPSFACGNGAEPFVR